MEIRVLIGMDGTYEVDVKGVKGKKCVDLTKAFESALGSVQKRTKKAEFYQSEQKTVKQGGGA